MTHRLIFIITFCYYKFTFKKSNLLHPVNWALVTLIFLCASIYAYVTGLDVCVCEIVYMIGMYNICKFSYMFEYIFNLVRPTKKYAYIKKKLWAIVFYCKVGRTGWSCVTVLQQYLCNCCGNMGYTYWVSPPNFISYLLANQSYGLPVMMWHTSCYRQ